MKHTKGPWKNRYDEFESSTIHTDEIDICEVLHQGEYEEEGLANANLIAAAPELLEACESVLNKLRDVGHYDTIKAANILQNAINKAEGNN